MWNVNASTTFKLDLNGLDRLVNIQVEENDGTVELIVIQERIPCQSIYFDSVNDFIVFCKVLQLYDS